MRDDCLYYTLYANLIFTFKFIPTYGNRKGLIVLKGTLEKTSQVMHLRCRDMNSFPKVTQPLNSGVIGSIRRESYFPCERDFYHGPPTSLTVLKDRPWPWKKSWPAQERSCLWRLSIFYKRILEQKEKDLHGHQTLDISLLRSQPFSPHFGGL